MNLQLVFKIKTDNRRGVFMKYYCSTGAFIGMINNRDHRLIKDCGPLIECDGIEFMMCDTWYDTIDSIITDVCSYGISFPVFHADKKTGDMISSLEPARFGDCIDLWKRNIEVAARIGSEKAVCHIWGRPDSDLEPMRIYERVQQLRRVSSEYGIDLLCENNACIHGSPLEHLYDYVNLDPTISLIIDTRAAQFHKELETIGRCDPVWPNIRHIHISDMRGDYKQWSALRPIYGPGEGDTDLARFFLSVISHGYDGSITLESPAMYADHVGVDELNKYMRYIKNGIEKAKEQLNKQ